MLLRLYLLLSTIAISTWSLTCYCKNTLQHQCTGDIEMCDKSEDVCIAWIAENGIIEYTCLELFEDGHSSNRVLIEDCLRGPIVNNFISFQCCNSTDRCNEYLNPPLPYLLRTTTTDQDSTSITLTTGPISGIDKINDSNDQIYIGLTIAIPVFSFILIIVMITAAVFYLFKRSLSNVGQILKQTLLDCSRSGYRNNRARAEPFYDVPDYYAVPPLPPRNEKPTTECDTEQSYCKIHEDDGNQDENLRQQHVHDPINDGIVRDPSIIIPNLDTVSEMSDEARVHEMQQNNSYLPSSTTPNFSDLAANPAYGTNIAIAPEILTEQNEAYQPRSCDRQMMTQAHSSNCTTSGMSLISEPEFDESRVPEMQQNSSYVFSTNVSDHAANPAYGSRTDVATAPEMLTEQSEAYEVRNPGMDNY